VAIRSPQDHDDIPLGGSPPSDGMLIEDVRSGRTQQFGLLVDRYQGALLRTAESRLGRRDWAEEAVQETFLCAFKWLSSYDSRYSFRTWLWTILLNQCRRLYKRRARQPDEVPWDAPEAVAEANQGGSVLAACESDMPLVRLMAKERRQHVQRLLQHLPEVQADALRLRFFGGLKFQEIADAMGCSLSTAKNRVRWGLTRLSEMMQTPAGDTAATEASEREGRGSR
jgi:RNA polymerase sigma-70 factor (ECF subfamily)